MSKLDRLYKWLEEIQNKGFEQIIITEVLNKIAQLQRERNQINESFRDIYQQRRFIFFVLAFIGTLYWSGDYTCKVKAEAQSMQYKFGPVMGCMVKYKGQWVDYDRLRYTGEE